jgi:hypothetical protein
LIDNWSEEVDRLDSVKKKRKDNSSASDAGLPFKSINLLAAHLGDSNAFADEEVSSEPSSLSNTEDDVEGGFFKDIMRYKQDASFSDAKVSSMQNMLNVSVVMTKEMEQEYKRMSRMKSRQSIVVTSANESKALSSRLGTMTPHGHTPMDFSRVNPRFHQTALSPHPGSESSRRRFSISSGSRRSISGQSSPKG